MYQTEWLGIQLSSFTQSSSLQQADEVFYNEFYKEFFKKFNSYEELPNEWKLGRQELIQHIFNKVEYSQLEMVHSGYK
jgi:hypothetical protein